MPCTYVGLPQQSTLEFKVGDISPLIRNTESVGIYTSMGSPQGVIMAAPGSVCFSPFGLYYKTGGCGATGWVLV